MESILSSAQRNNLSTPGTLHSCLLTDLHPEGDWGSFYIVQETLKHSTSNLQLSCNKKSRVTQQHLTILSSCFLFLYNINYPRNSLFGFDLAKESVQTKRQCASFHAFGVSLSPLHGHKNSLYQNVALCYFHIM